jgi:sugar O-acyltransferase (sialic acid O-acetyltransferase NeuD family)
MRRVVGLGAGGHARVVIEILLAAGGTEVVGLLDPVSPSPDVRGVPVLGGDDLLTELDVDGAFVGVGSVGDASLRRRLYELIVASGVPPVDAVHPSAVVSPSVQSGRGLTLMALAVVSADARIGHNVVVNTSATIEHDCVLADHVYVASGAQLGAGVRVGEGAHVGLGASVNQGLRVGERAIVGSGAVVVRDVPDDVVVAGVPARLLRGRPA